MIDSHCHLTDPRLLEQLDDVLARASSAGVNRIITIGVDPDDSAAAVDLCRMRSGVISCAVGVHPNYCHEVEESEVGRIRALATMPGVVAIGEIGLDYHHHFADRNRQKRFFEAQLALAIELKLPVVIHCREAVDDCLAIMSRVRIAADFHCFTGSIAEADRIIDAGYLLGFTGVVTFKKSDDLREVARRIPADRILVETDGPYLSPEPFRKQKVNEPALVVHTAKAVAEARGVELDVIDFLTTRNAERFFSLV